MDIRSIEQSATITRMQKHITDYDKETVQLKAKISGIKGAVSKAIINNQDTSEHQRKLNGLLEILKVRIAKAQMLESMLNAAKSGVDVQCTRTITVTMNDCKIEFELGKEF